MMMHGDGLDTPGSPAHAGIDPPEIDEKRAEIGFPRPRGDRPLVVQMPTGAGKVPPPTRG